MAQLFKKNIIKEKLADFVIPNFEEKLEVLKSWKAMQENKTLEKSTEIELQGPFGEKFFSNILGYENIGDGEYSMKFEPKVPVGGQKADIGLGFFSERIDKMKVVVELKDARTSLDKPQQRAGNLTPVQQAFKYKPYFKECDFIIVSNFLEIRLYLDSYYDYEIWTLDDLVNPKNNYFNFRKFYYLLCKQNLIKKSGESNTKSLLSKIRIQEKEITKKFYSEYTLLRKELFKDIILNNPGFKKSELDFLLNKTQKIIDRIIFIHFCEDLGLLPQGKLKEVIEYGEKSLATTWETLQNFFRAVDSGSEKLGIPDGYNGGLFHTDEKLNNLKVGDKICKKFIDLGDYDFADDLSVNILGHIFEQSISDIEELKDKIRKDEEPTLSKRKKDGVFYTPEYIVDYIVKNSVGKKIDDWEEELKTKYNLSEKITDKNYSKRAISVYTELQEKVQNIKVLDPACGSGAFLVKVFDFLLDKNKEISKILEDLGINQGLFSTEGYLKTILQNNIFGVDLNEESVEITKLSLWLKTAIKGKKLANLDSNIKCGNSLIDDPEVAGGKAFVWEEEFSEILGKRKSEKNHSDNQKENGKNIEIANSEYQTESGKNTGIVNSDNQTESGRHSVDLWEGGFDVIVGNPPYVDIKMLPNDDVKYFFNEYKTAENRINLYSIFIEKSLNILKNNGNFSFVIPSSILMNGSYSEIRKKILDETKINQLIKLPDNVFENIKVETMIFSITKSINNKDNIVYFNQYPREEKLSFLSNPINIIEQNYYNTGTYDFNLNLGNEDIKILEKIELNSLQLIKLSDFCLGFTPYDKYKGHSADLIKNKKFHSTIKENELYKPLISGDNIKRYNLTCDFDNYIKYGKWLGAPREERFFKNEHLIIRQIISNNRLFVGYDKGGFYNAQIGFNLIPKDDKINIKFLLSLLNSKLISFYHGKKFLDLTKNLFQKILIVNAKQLPIKNIPLSEQKPFIEKADFMLDKNRELQEKINKFLKRLNSNFEIDKLSTKLKNFFDLEFGDFVKELKKKKVVLSLKEQDEWEEYFEGYKKEILEIKKEIDACDKEIDEMVFDLYGLSDEEREVVREV